MSWSRNTSQLEEYMHEILSRAKKPLTLGEISEKIILKHPDAFRGNTPERSLYSIIYRREKRRISAGLKPLLIKSISDHVARYSLNPESKDADVGSRIENI